MDTNLRVIRGKIYHSLLSVLVVGTALVFPQMAWAQHESQSVNARDHALQFVVIMNGPATFDATGLNIDLYAVSRGPRIGKATFVLLCIDGTFVPGVPRCNPDAVLLPGEIQYRDLVTFALPGGPIQGELMGWSVPNSKPAEHGGFLVTSVIEEGTISSATGIYARATGSFHSRIVTEVNEFGPVFVDRGLVLFDLKVSR
jgi:hypothetical protein